MFQFEFRSVKEAKPLPNTLVAVRIKGDGTPFFAFYHNDKFVVCIDSQPSSEVEVDQWTYIPYDSPHLLGYRAQGDGTQDQAKPSRRRKRRIPVDTNQNMASLFKLCDKLSNQGVPYIIVFPKE